MTVLGRACTDTLLAIPMPTSSQLSMSMMPLGDIGTLLSPGALGRRVEQRASLQA